MNLFGHPAAIQPRATVMRVTRAIHGLPQCAALLVRPFAMAAVASLPVALAHAQITPTAHNGENAAYCGIPGVGPKADHRFLTLAPTDDTIVLSDPSDGTYPASSASAHLVDSVTPSSLLIAMSGASQRGALIGPGVYATADSRDFWDFTVTARRAFRLTVTMSVTSSETPAALSAFNFSALGGGALELSSGAVVTGLSQGLTNPGVWEMSWAGTIRPGQYNAGLTGRIEGNLFPFFGSYSNSVRFVVGCLADFDADGFLTGDDFDGFSAAFVLGEMSSDFDGDGFVTGDDFDGYVVAFENGC